MGFLIPEKIETERLILRTLKHDDWHDLHAYYSDDMCIKYTIGHTLTEGESWRTMASAAGHWYLRGYGPYALQEKANGTVLGLAGLWYPNDWPGPEIKWALSRQFWGKGYASEAVRAVKKMALKHIPELALISLIHSENIRSVNLAIAVGAKFEKEIYFRDYTWHVYRH